MVEFKKPGVPAERSVKHRIKSQKAKLKVKNIFWELKAVYLGI